MSMALAHFAFGAAMTTLAVTFLVPAVRYPRTWALVGGGWAMLPDLHWVSPIAAERLRQVHQTAVWTDLFWLHRTLDRLDPADAEAVAAGFLVALVIATAIAERRDYRAPAAVRSTRDALLESG